MYSGVLIAISPRPEDGPLLTRRIGGLPLVLRQARLLRAAGAQRLTVICRAADADACAAALSGTHGVPDTSVAPITAVEELPEAVTRAVGAPPAPVLVLNARWVLQRRAVEAVRDATSAGAPFAVGLAPQDLGGGGVALVAASADRAAEAARWIGAAVVGDPPPQPASAVTVALEPAHVVGVLADEASRARIEDALWEGCRKPTDGIVSRRFNRHVSLFISRRIAATPITPNHVSMLTLLLGVAAALCAARGTYGWVLIGAALLKLNSVLDGVDGELARVRVQASVLGEWLDTVSDDISNQGFFAGLAWGAFTRTGDALWLYAGAATIIPMVTTSLLYYRWCYARGRGDILVLDWFQPREPSAEELARRGLLQRLGDAVTPFFRRDSFVTLLLIIAALDVVRYALFMFAPVGLGILVGVLLKNRAAHRR